MRATSQHACTPAAPVPASHRGTRSALQTKSDPPDGLGPQVLRRVVTFVQRDTLGETEQAPGRTRQYK